MLATKNYKYDEGGGKDDERTACGFYLDEILNFWRGGSNLGNRGVVGRTRCCCHFASDDNSRRAAGEKCLE